MAEPMGMIDTDIHTMAFPTSPPVRRHLSTRWVEYMDMLGLRRAQGGSMRPPAREFFHRTDSVPDNGIPGSDPDFARMQLLDEYDLSAAIINDNVAFYAHGLGAHPLELDIELAHAYNEYRREEWLAHDDRWYASVTLPFEAPEASAREIVRCREETGEHGRRFVQTLMPPNLERPAGNHFYWPIWEACEHYGIPAGFHARGAPKATPSGDPSFYFEEHANLELLNFPLVASLIFEGVFDRFPKLRVVLLELGWSWAMFFAWRMDRLYNQLWREVSHLKRRPSEYFRDHFYFTTQPLEEPENPAWSNDLYEMFERSGFNDNLMFSTDYPHWDFDPPTVLSPALPEATRRRIFGETASELYDIPLRPVTSLRAEPTHTVPSAVR